MPRNLNLEQLFNHKFIYRPNELNQENLGLDNTYITKDEFSSNYLTGQNSIIFNLSNIYYDNIICNNQELVINEYVETLHILGFSYWGSTNIFLKIVFENNTILQKKIPFIDWVTKSNINYQTQSWYGGDIKTIKQVQTKGILNHIVHFHHSITKVDSSMRVKKIIFPDNFLVHIFAITIE